MKLKVFSLMAFAALELAVCVYGAAPPSAPEATITSDELEILNNGAKTVFTGHVILKQVPYVLLADRMVQTKATGIVEAAGHIHGTWTGPSGEKIVATGTHARYTPAAKSIELWDDARLTRWE